MSKLITKYHPKTKVNAPSKPAGASTPAARPAFAHHKAGGSKVVQVRAYARSKK